MYLEEAAALYEELSKKNSNAIMSLLDTYSLMGEYDKAEKKALEQPKLEMSREISFSVIMCKSEYLVDFLANLPEKVKAHQICRIIQKINTTSLIHAC